MVMVFKFLLTAFVVLITVRQGCCFTPSYPVGILADITGLSWPGGTVPHTEMTQQVCLEIAKDVLLEEVTSIVTFTKLVTLAFGDGSSAADFQEAVDAISKANVAVDSNEDQVSSAHFDAENFQEGNARLLALRSCVIREILSGSLENARVSAGRLLHTLQDFYSHSNWIELGNRIPHPDLAKVGRAPSNIALPNTPTCRNCHSKFAIFFTGTCRNNLLVGNSLPPFLTSGYYTGKKYYFAGASKNQDRTKPDAKTLIRTSKDQGKCSHGGLLDKSRNTTADGGINKDSTNARVSPHWYLHKEAAAVATEASRSFLEDIREQVGNRLFLRFLGLDYGASISFAIDTTKSMRPVITAVKQAVHHIIDSHIADGSVPTEYVLVQFNDPKVGPVDVTDDPEEFKRIVSNINVYSVASNTDNPELSISGLLLALEKSRPGSTVYVFTDSDPKDQYKYKTALTLIFKKKIIVYFILTQVSRRRRDTVTPSSTYTELAAQSGGQVLYGKAADVGKLLTLTSSFTEPSDVTLLSIDSSIPALSPDGHNWTVPVDSSVTNITVSVSGKNPVIYLYDGYGNQVTVNSSNAVRLGSAAVLKLNELIVDAVKVQVFTQSLYTLRVKGLSSLDLQYSLVVPQETSHFGLYPIRGRPRIGNLVYVRVVIVGLTDDQMVERLVFQAENGTIIDGLLLETLNATGSDQFLTSSPLVVPATPFQVGLEGREISTGTAFKRLDVTVVTPTNFQLDVQPGSNFVLKQGVTSTLSFLVLNGPQSLQDSFSFAITDELNLAGDPSPSIFTLGPNENSSIDVNFVVPSCYQSAGIDTVTVTVSSRTTTEFNSFVLKIIIDSEFVDSDPPVCALMSVDDCTLSGNTCSSSWRVRWNILDAGSPLYRIAPLSNKTSVQYSTSQVEHFNTRILVTADIPCCVNEEILTVTDFFGNKANCSVTKASEVPRCTSPCHNEGLCVGSSQCICRGGYYGALCQNTGCPRPPAPANGQVASSSSYSIGDRAEWICNSGYEMIGRNTTVCCPVGWTGAIPQCVQTQTAPPTNEKTGEAVSVKSNRFMTAVCMFLLLAVGLN